MNYIPIENLIEGRLKGPDGMLDFPSLSWRKVVESYPQYFAVAAADGSKEYGPDRYLNQRQFALVTNVFDIQCFPVGVYLRSLTDRSHTEEMGTSPFFHAPWFDRGAVLFVVEGYLDMLSVARVCPTVVGCGSNSLTKEQVKWLSMMHKSGVFQAVVVIHDNDEKRADGRKPGMEGAMRSKQYLEEAGLPGMRLPTPFGKKDPGDLYEFAGFEDWIFKLIQSLGCVR